MPINHEKLHNNLQKLIAKNKKKAQKRKRAQLNKPIETPTYFIPHQQYAFSTMPHIPQTLAEQYQVNQIYRQQLMAEDEDTGFATADTVYNAYTQQQDQPVSFAGGYGNVPDVQALVEENQKRQHIEMQYLTEIEARCRALMKEQQKAFNQNPIDLQTMKLLEKSTRTLWVSKISELITEQRARDYCKLYGDVLRVNIVEDDGKRCGFIEFATSDGVQKFLQTSNLMMCGERIVCKPANVTKAAVNPGVSAGYVNDQTNSLTPMFQSMLDTVNSRHALQKKKDDKPKTMNDYFPDLPENRV